MKKYVRTAPKNSTEDLMLIKMDELIGKINSLLEKLDSDSGVADTDYAAELGDIKKAAEDIIGE